MRYLDKTPRQWLITFAVGELKRWRFEGTAHKDPLQAARLAMESTVDGGKPGTLRGAMLAYYCGCTEQTRERLDATIARLAH
jgi:hypothetical protein